MSWALTSANIPTTRLGRDTETDHCDHVATVRTTVAIVVSMNWTLPSWVSRVNLDLKKMKQKEDAYVKLTIEEDKDKKMKMSNKTVEEDKPRPMDFAT